MILIWNVIFYIMIFVSVYVQVFFLITFIENRKKIVVRDGSIKLAKYPTVTVIVPCWNEEKTIYKTVRSLLDLNYPKDKLKIFLIDDGSTDGTWDTILKFANYSNIKIFHKENGGKYSALNLGLKNMETEFFGCLDADSVATPESLIRLMSYFEKDPSSMAVTPSLVVCNAKTMLQKAQIAEYNMSVYLKKMLGFLGAIHVTPGPLTIFRKKVFDDLGPYHHAHGTEDMEIAYRMQKNHYKIEQCNDAYVYTNTPATVVKLYKQRLRWIYGFINNTIDYRKIIFNKKYGDFSMFTVPSGLISVVAAGLLFGKSIYNFCSFVSSKIIQYKTTGFNLPKTSNFDLFFINTQAFSFIAILLFALIILSMVLGQKIANNKIKLSFNMIYFIFVYSLIAPFWLVKAIFNTIFSRKPAWR